MDMGLDINKFDAAARARPTDERFVIAYPHFNVNGVCVCATASARLQRTCTYACT